MRSTGRAEPNQQRGKRSFERGIENQVEDVSLYLSVLFDGVRDREGSTEMEQHPEVLTIEDARRRVLGDHRAVFLIAVVPTVIQLVADQRAQTQTIPIGAVELALCAGKGGWGERGSRK